MIEKAGVICTPGSSFGPSGEGYVRFALTLPVEKITEAVQAVRHIRADGAEAPAQGVAAALVFGTLGLDGLQRACHSGNGGFLLRDELAEIDLGAQLLACGNHIAAAHQKADARAETCAVEFFSLSKSFNVTGNVEDAVTHGTIKDDIAVGVIMDEQNLMCIAEIHDLLVQR